VFIISRVGVASPSLCYLLILSGLVSLVNTFLLLFFRFVIYLTIRDRHCHSVLNHLSLKVLAVSFKTFSILSSIFM